MSEEPRRRGRIRSSVRGFQPAWAEPRESRLYALSLSLLAVIRALAREQRVAEERVIEDLLRQQLDLPQADIVIDEQREIGE